MHGVKSGIEASKMLEAALQQMDGIIGNAPPASFSERSLISSNNVISTAKTLALALQQVGVAAPAPDPVTAAIISDWLDTHIPRQDSDERLRRLQRDKESLALQYQMLAERVSEQTDKITELEGMLTEKTQQLFIKDEQIQRQMVTRSSLETQKLELMTALSELKLHRVALEHDTELQMGSGNCTYTNENQLSLGGSISNLCNRVYSPNVAAPKTPPASTRHQIKPQFNSLPRSLAGMKPKANFNNNNNIILDANANSSKQRNVVFASNEKIVIDDENINEATALGNTSMHSVSGLQAISSPSPSLRDRSTKSLRNILGKLRRSNSGSLEFPGMEQADPEFRRGGSRATAGGRIEWTSQLCNSSKECKDWSANEVCNWLIDLGLGSYEDACRKWLKANPSVCFFNVSPIDIDKELNLKMPLHRKKIILAIDEITGKEKDELALKAGLLDTNWVLRWLDDIGLPQYKDYFLQAKVDGRMLHRLTLEDLSQLHVSSCLHIASLRCGIQCMREMIWNPECLIRRSTSTKSTPNDHVDVIGDDVKTWTTHRVMEWLRVADLSEYAPNLRGAGVHGALMLNEKRFNANLLADLLSIPPSKSLLRRHLATHFKELLGRDIIQTKRDVEAEPGYQPLTISAKLKPPKKTQFSLKRRKSNKGSTDIEWTEYVCPMTVSNSSVVDTVAELSSTHSSSTL